MSAKVVNAAVERKLRDVTHYMYLEIVESIEIFQNGTNVVKFQKHHETCIKIPLRLMAEVKSEWESMPKTGNIHIKIER